MYLLCVCICMHVCMLSHFNCVQLFCDPMNCSLPGSSVPGTLQSRILELVAIPYSRGSSRSRDRAQISYVSALASGLYTTNTAWWAHTYIYDVYVYAYISPFTLELNSILYVIYIRY